MEFGGNVTHIAHARSPERALAHEIMGALTSTALLHKFEGFVLLGTRAIMAELHHVMSQAVCDRLIATGIETPDGEIFGSMRAAEKRSAVQ